MPVEFDRSFWETCWTHRRGIRQELMCAILAAGLGRRMDPLTVRHIPKPMFPLGGKVPMAELWVRRIVESGIVDISMNLCVLGETIKRHFRDGLKFAVPITYIEEATPSGTLGGVCLQALRRDSRRLVPLRQEPTTGAFKGSTVIVPSGDIVTNFDSALLEEMYDIHRKAGAALTMVLVPVPWERRKDFGTVALDRPRKRHGLISSAGMVKQFVEKDPNSPSNLNNASIYMIEMDLIRALDKIRTEANPNLEHPFYDFGKHVFPALLGDLEYISLRQRYPLWGIQYDGSWFDVGQKRDYLKVNEYVLDGRIDLPLPYEKLPWGFLGTKVTVDFSRMTLKPPVVIGNNCVVAPGASLGPYAIIGDDWTIEEDVVVEHSVLWDRYSYFDRRGIETPADDRKLVDRHEVRHGVKIKHSIVTGGTIDVDVSEQTVDVFEDGRLGILPIDYVPKEERA